MTKEQKTSAKELFISVDIEASGPIPYQYSMLSLGACVVTDPEVNFYVEMKPINDNYDPEALKVAKLSIPQLRKSGKTPKKAMKLFDNWIVSIKESKEPIFVGFNAPFDWQFVNWYFYKYLGRNPFGIRALDIKAYYMGYSGLPWSETSSSKLPKWLKVTEKNRHNSLADAITQARIFESLMSRRNHRNRQLVR